MTSLRLARYSLSISGAIAWLAGCGGSQAPIGATGHGTVFALTP
ncbi:MAG: hypothetical protein WBE30_05420 [Candidatus Cybelea sp.]